MQDKFAELDDEPIDNVIGAARGADGVRMQPIESGSRVRLFYQATGATSVFGTRLIVSSEDGKVGPAAGTEFDDVIVGILAQNVTQDNTNDQIVEVII